MNARELFPFFFMVPILFFAWGLSAILSAIALASFSLTTEEAFFAQQVAFVVLSIVFAIIVFTIFGRR